MKKIIFISLIMSVILNTNSFGQLKETFEKGFLVTIDNQKIDGYIKSEEFAIITKRICFKTEINSEKQIKYNTSQIKSFQTENGKIFELMTLKINNNETEISLFANLILKGKASLYKSNYNSDDFYIVENENNYYVLQNDKLLLGETTIRNYNFGGYLNIATEGLSDSKGKITFNEANFVKIITEYNHLKDSKSIPFSYKEAPKRFFVLATGGSKKNDENEFFAQGFYRIYYPKISKSTSINLGICFYNYQYKETYYSLKKHYKSTLTSLPIQFQQNLLNKNFRPYFFGGISLDYKEITQDINTDVNENGFQKNYGIGILYGGGFELDLYKGIMLKSEYRYEIFKHLILFGIGYHFSY